MSINPQKTAVIIERKKFFFQKGAQTVSGCTSHSIKEHSVASSLAGDELNQPCPGSQTQSDV